MKYGVIGRFPALGCGFAVAGLLLFPACTGSVSGNGSPTDYKAFGISDGARLIGHRVRLVGNESSMTGQAFRVTGASSALLTDCEFPSSTAVHIEDVEGFVLTIDCEFNRSSVTGQTARLQDVISPLRPTTAGRTLDVSATGEAGLDLDNIKQATGATTLTNITVPTVTNLTNAPSGGALSTAQDTKLTEIHERLKAGR